MPGSQFFNSFADEMADTLLVWTKGFQVGSDRILPPTPEEFENQLSKEVNGFGINFPGTSEPAQVVQDTIDAYAAWYKVILLKKLPENAPDAYIAWYNATHPDGVKK